MCWDNFIGVDSVCTPISESGFNFIDIGISKHELDSYIGIEFSNGQELAQNKVDFAASSIQNILNTSFGGKFKTSSLIDNATAGTYNDNLVSESSVLNTLKGIQLECVNSTSYLTINVTSVSLQVAFTGIVNVLVYDLLQDRLLDTIPVDTVDGQIARVSLNKVYPTNKQKSNIFIGYDSQFDSYKSTVSALGCSSCTSNYWAFSSKYVRNTGGQIPVSSTKIKSNVISNNSTGGLSVEYGVSCDFSNWLCSVKHSVSLPMLYKAGEMIMDYALQQKQWNSNTSIRREDVSKRRDQYRSEYEKHMSGVLNSMSPPRDTMCFRCDGPVKTVITLP